MRLLTNIFNIVKQDYYIVIDGNAITGFANGLDTLTLLLRLMNLYPKHVGQQYRGAEEDREQWEHYPIGQELKIRMPRFNVESMKDLINRLINTFPLTFDLVAKRTDRKAELVRICSYGSEFREFEEKNMAGDSLDPQIRMIQIGEQKKGNSESISVRAIINGEQFTKEKYTQSQGLRKAGTKNDAVIWNLFSGPVGSYRCALSIFL